MSTFVIQVKRDGAWCKVSTFEDHQAVRSKRKAAISAAFLGLAAWRSSDQFIGMQLRVAEATGWYGAAAYKEITGAGA
jgi:hypothetical protein